MNFYAFYGSSKIFNKKSLCRTQQFRFLFVRFFKESMFTFGKTKFINSKIKKL